MTTRMQVAPFRRVQQIGNARDLRHAAMAMAGTLQVTSDDEAGEAVEGDTGFTAHIEGDAQPWLRSGSGTHGAGLQMVRLWWEIMASPALKVMQDFNSTVYSVGCMMRCERYSGGLGAGSFTRVVEICGTFGCRNAQMSASVYIQAV